MGETKDDSAKLAEYMQKQEELERIKNETAAKRVLIDQQKANAQLALLQEGARNAEILAKSSYDKLSEEEINQMVEANDAYMEAAKNALVFLNEDFDRAVSFHGKNIISILGQTGEGKSTTVANIVFNLLNQKVNGRPSRILVITNEEAREDMYNRLIAFSQGWHYSNHREFTDHQRNVFSKGIRALAKSGRVTVIHDTHNGATGVTTTLEGIKTILDKLQKDKVQYDAILIDYYQKIAESTQFPFLKEHEVQAKVMGLLDNFKNIYPAPIVLMAQVRPPKEDSDEPPEYRMKGSKSILVKSTVVLELFKDATKLRTGWRVYKGRFSDAIGQTIYTGFDKGRFVRYTKEFILQATEILMRKSLASVDKQNGIKSENKENT